MYIKFPCKITNDIELYLQNQNLSGIHESVCDKLFKKDIFNLFEIMVFVLSLFVPANDTMLR